MREGPPGLRCPTSARFESYYTRGACLSIWARVPAPLTAASSGLSPPPLSATGIPPQWVLLLPDSISAVLP